MKERKYEKRKKEWKERKSGKRESERKMNEIYNKYEKAKFYVHTNNEIDIYIYTYTHL